MLILALTFPQTFFKYICTDSNNNNSIQWQMKFYDLFLKHIALEAVKAEVQLKFEFSKSYQILLTTLVFSVLKRCTLTDNPEFLYMWLRASQVFARTKSIQKFFYAPPSQRLSFERKEEREEKKEERD